MVLLALDRDAPLPDGDDAGHNPGTEAGTLELRPLLDVHLEESLVPFRLEPHARQAGEAGGSQCLSQGRSVRAVAAAVDLLVGQVADDGSAAEEAAFEMPLLIG